MVNTVIIVFHKSLDRRADNYCKETFDKVI